MSRFARTPVRVTYTLDLFHESRNLLDIVGSRINLSILPSSKCGFPEITGLVSRLEIVILTIPFPIKLFAGLEFW